MSRPEPVVHRSRPADEGRHPAGPEELWGESWYLDWAAADCSYGGYVRLGLYPNLGHGPGGGSRSSAPTARSCSSVDHDLPCPDGDAALDQSAGGTEVAISWPEPMRTFRVTSRAEGVVLPDPAQAFHGLDGERVPVDARPHLDVARRAVPVRDDHALRDLVVGHAAR